MDLYFVGADKASIETQAISELKPERLLCSYFYFKSKKLEDYAARLGYRPKILLDCGAYSAQTQGKSIAIQDYMQYIRDNADFIERYIALDVIGDPDMTYDFYRIMVKKDFSPMPVYHYGVEEGYLQRYVDEGNQHITLGGTVPIADKKKVADWARQLIEKYPGVRFHLLGSCSTPIMFCEGLSSCDSSTWILQAIMGNPKHIPGKSKEAKLQRARFNLMEIQSRLELLG